MFDELTGTCKALTGFKQHLCLCKRISSQAMCAQRRWKILHSGSKPFPGPHLSTNSTMLLNTWQLQHPWFQDGTPKSKVAVDLSISLKLKKRTREQNKDHGPFLTFASQSFDSCFEPSDLVRDALVLPFQDECVTKPPHLNILPQVHLDAPAAT